MYKPSSGFSKINDSRRLPIEIKAKYIMTAKLSPRSCQNRPYSADWVI